MRLDIANIRKDYKLQSLNESDCANNPFDQFEKWWQQAIHSEIEEVNAMTLATATKTGLPSARIVLLKDYSKDGFVFFTNYNSHKGHELAENPHAALVFFWKELERQIRIEGIVEKASVEESDTYFQQRPEGSRIGAWASPQSRIIKNREELELAVQKFTQQYEGGFIPRPDFWGGYCVKAVMMEFWQGRSNRLHDRIQYNLQANGSWEKVRLAP
jgi:pyridoxamine 5'-phosphate oxidase